MLCVPHPLAALGRAAHRNRLAVIVAWAVVRHRPRASSRRASSSALRARCGRSTAATRSPLARSSSSSSAASRRSRPSSCMHSDTLTVDDPQFQAKIDAATAIFAGEAALRPRRPAAAQPGRPHRHDPGRLARRPDRVGARRRARLRRRSSRLHATATSPSR